MWHSKVIEVIIVLMLIEDVIMDRKIQRNARALSFPESSTLGILIAIAVPLDLPNRNVFFSYNFEANYNLPGDLETAPKERKRRKSKRGQNNTFILPTRSEVYDILNNLLLRHSTAKSCLLRLICEVSNSDWNYSNGLLGDIFKIFLMPSLSKKEQLLLEFHIAEHSGLKNNCQAYDALCSNSIFNYLTKP